MFQKFEDYKCNCSEPIEDLYSFRDLFADFISGTPIKRKHWGGYWKYTDKVIRIHTRCDDVLNIRETDDILFTISHIMMHDWVIATNENCDIEVK